ncbi:MAG: NAD-dependent deacylase [Litorimonas sp.]
MAQNRSKAYGPDMPSTPLRPAPRLFVLTGAGISAESGLKTFRDNDGLWETHRVEDVATPEAFARDPDLVQRFYNQRRASLSEARPNAAHHALGQLQRRLREADGDLVLVTQNVDDLHERGGAQDVIHMHGELTRGLCSACGFRWTVDGDLLPGSACPACGTVGGPRPDIVWFGEMPYQMDRIERELARADRFVSIGTSGAVYPAAGFVQAARAAGVPTLELNLEPSLGSAWFDEARHGPAGTVVPEWAEAVPATLG